jgi:HSP20 family molecular chaperone IbpA
MSYFNTNPSDWMDWFFILDNTKGKTALTSSGGKYYNSLGVQENTQEVVNGETVCKVTVPLPGFPKENISVKTYKDKLTINAEFDNRKVNEIFYNKDNLYDLTGTKVTYFNGLLKVIIPLAKKNDEGVEVLIE